MAFVILTCILLFTLLVLLMHVEIWLQLKIFQNWLTNAANLCINYFVINVINWLNYSVISYYVPVIFTLSIEVNIRFMLHNLHKHNEHSPFVCLSATKATQHWTFITIRWQTENNDVRTVIITTKFYHELRCVVKAASTQSASPIASVSL